MGEANPLLAVDVTFFVRCTALNSQVGQVKCNLFGSRGIFSDQLLGPQQKNYQNRRSLKSSHYPGHLQETQLPPIHITDLRRREAGPGHPRSPPRDRTRHSLQPRGRNGRPSSSRSRRPPAAHPRCAPHAVDAVCNRPLLQEPRHVGVFPRSEGPPGGAGGGA